MTFPCHFNNLGGEWYKCTQGKRKYLLLLRNLKVHGNNESLKVETGFLFKKMLCLELNMQL